MNVLGVSLGSHSGTHVDAPYHFVEDGTRIDEMDLDLFCGPAVIVDVPGKEARERIPARDLERYGERLGPGAVVVFRTGWDRYWGTPRYYEHPFLDRGAAELLLEAGVRTLAIDALNVDETVFDAPHPEDFPVHRLFLGAGGVIAENLTNLGALDFTAPWVYLLPIKLGGADGAPVRAVAVEAPAECGDRGGRVSSEVPDEDETREE
jgi:kynurenine formamidase